MIGCNGYGAFLFKDVYGDVQVWTNLWTIWSNVYVPFSNGFGEVWIVRVFKYTFFIYVISSKFMSTGDGHVLNSMTHL